MPLTCFKSSVICAKNTERVLLQDNSVWPSSSPRQQWQQLPAFLQGPAPDLLGSLHLLPAYSLPGSCQAFMWLTKWCFPWIHQLCGGNFALQVPVPVLELLTLTCFWVSTKSGSEQHEKGWDGFCAASLLSWSKNFLKIKHRVNQISSVEWNKEIHKEQVS